MDSIYIHLHSNGSNELYPSNNSSKFVNKLLRPLLLSHHAYEVGLVDIGYKHLKTLFPIKDGQSTDNYINLQKTDSFTKELELEKRDSIVINSLIIRLNQLFAANNLNINFKTEKKITEENISIIEIKDQNIFLEIDESLAEILGFLNTNFTQGKVNSSSQQKQDIFIELSMYHTFKLTVKKFIPKQVFYVSEPTDFKFDMLLASINRALQNTQVAFRKLRKGVQITLPQDTALEFSPILANIFGVKSLDKTSELTVDVSDIKQPSKVLVLLDIVKNQYLDSKTLPYIKIFEQSSNNPVFNPILYVPLSKDYIENIQVEIVDEFLNPVPVVDRPSWVTLHIKAKHP